MELIKASKEHISIIQAIADEVWPRTFGEILSSEQIVYMMNMMYATASLEKQIEELNHRYLLAKDNNDYVGFLSYERDYKGKPWTKIHKIYVLSSAQGKGIGQYLITTAADIAKEHNNSELTLNVNRYNHKAVKFYERLKFEIVGSEDIDIENGYVMEDFIMNKRLF